MGKTIKEILESKVMFEPNTGCWLWTGCLNSWGYGKIYNKYQSLLAHRASYTLYKGSIDDNKILLHDCDTPSCINPDHLRVGTNKENSKDMMIRNRRKFKLTKDDIKIIRDMYDTGKFFQ